MSGTSNGDTLEAGPVLKRTLSEHVAVRSQQHLDKSLHAGALPADLGSADVQKLRALQILRNKPNDLDKYEYLAGIRSSNTALLYRLLIDHLEELAPYVYTPTVGAACQQWHKLFNFSVEALYLSANDKGKLASILSNYEQLEDVEIAVVTDGSRILGLGDLGVGGIGIPIGKLSLYIACAGVHPGRSLPVILDLGTNNEALRNDPLYLGLKQPRLKPEATKEFVREFMAAFHTRYPRAVVQFEDFSNDTCFDILAESRVKYPSFNDDIQGTAAVTLAGVVRALQLTGKSFAENRFVFFGAGSAAVGIAEMMRDYGVQQGLSLEAASNLFWLVDSKGLVANNRGDKLQPHKLSLSRKEPDLPRLETLEAVIEYVKPTALLGLSTVGGAFTASILQKMASFNELPIVFPLSNPTSKSECTFEQALQQTKGKVLFASGSPFLPVMYEGVERKTLQANNVWVFPGIGLGAILAQVKIIPEELLHAAANALATSLSQKEIVAGQLFPDLARIRSVSAAIAVAVIRAAQSKQVDQRKELRLLNDSELLSYVQKAMYDPQLRSSYHKL